MQRSTNPSSLLFRRGAVLLTAPLLMLVANPKLASAQNAVNCPTVSTVKVVIPKACQDQARDAILAAGYFNIKAYQQAIGVAPAKEVERVGPTTYFAVQSGKLLAITSKNKKDNVVVDVVKQLAVFFKDGKAKIISRTSTGSGKEYTYKGTNGKPQKGIATTGLGKFRIFRTEGADFSSQTLGGDPGSMAWALFFNKGEALHSGVIPKDGTPSSHGCVRLDKGVDQANPADDAVKAMIDNGLGVGDAVTVVTDSGLFV